MAIRDVEVNIRGIKDQSNRLKQLEKLSVKVGIQSDAGTYPDGTRLVDVAVWQAFGTVRKDGSVHIPARPFLQEAVRRYQRRISRAAKKLAKMVAKGEMEPHTAVGQMGLLMTRCVQDTLRKGPWIPLAASTVRRKKSSVPLIDKAFMVNAIRHEVVSNEK